MAVRWRATQENRDCALMASLPPKCKRSSSNKFAQRCETFDDFGEENLALEIVKSLCFICHWPEMKICFVPLNSRVRRKQSKSADFKSGALIL